MTNLLLKRTKVHRALLLLAIIISCALQSHAGTDFTYNGLTYTTLTDNTCETKQGSNNKPGNYVSGDLVIPETVYDENGVAYSVTSIGMDGFSYCNELTSISIPNTVTDIGLFAFFYCTGLSKVNIENLAAWCKISFSWAMENPLYYAHHLYIHDQEITDLVIPNTVTNIGKNTFYGCTDLTSITIPSSVISIGSEAFAYCTSLKKFVVESDNSYFASDETGALYNKDMSTLLVCPCIKTEFEIPESVTSIEDYAFYCCRDLSSVYIPNSVPSIGYFTFAFCTSLTSITIPNSVTEIGYCAFYNCTSLASVIIPNSVSSIEEEAFGNCICLTSITIPESVTSIASSAFLKCLSLKKFVVESGNSCFSTDEVGALYNKDLSMLLICPGSKTEFEIPESVTSIGNSAFYCCRDLSSVSIPNSVTSIGNFAFCGCSGLASITIPNSVTSIGGYTFWGCTSLTSITIPNSVTSIGYYAFLDCTGITKLTLEDGDNDLTINAGAFMDVAPKEVYFGRQMDFSVVSLNALETVEFGENVTSIASGAFKDGAAIRTVVSRNVMPPTTEDPFDDTTYLDGVLYVPDASIEAYQAAAGWKNFWEIKPLSEYSGVEGVVVDEDVETISVDNGAISVSGDVPVRIVALSGTTVYSGRGNCSINVTPGIYVVIVGNKARKVAVR